LHNSKLIITLKSLSANELNRFADYVKSPIFNTKTILSDFVDLIITTKPSFTDDLLLKENVYKKLYADIPYDDRKMRWLMSYMLDLLYDYFAFIQNESKAINKKIMLLEQFRARCLNDDFEKLYLQLKKEAEETDFREYDNLYYKNHFAIEQIADNYAVRTKMKKGIPIVEDHLQQMHIYLDRLYLVSKFKLGCKTATRNFQLPFSKELIQKRKILSLNMAEKAISHLLDHSKSYLTKD
jgi:hypothetical protein